MNKKQVLESKNNRMDKNREGIIFENSKEVLDYMEANNSYSLYLWVDHNPKGEGKRTKLLFEMIYNDSITSWLPENLLPEDPVDYQFNTSWAKYYEGTFTLAEETEDLRFRRPDVYEVGDLVQVMDIAREVGGFEIWSTKAQDMVGNVYIINTVNDNSNGVYYNLKNGEGEYRFPCYCVKKKPQVFQAIMKAFEKLSDENKQIIIEAMNELKH